MAIKAILFDLDGTLIDTIPFHKKSFHLLFEKFGQHLHEREIARYIRWSTDEIYHKLHVKKRLGLDMEHFLELRRDIVYGLFDDRNLLIENRLLLLRKLKKHFKLGLVTNSSRQTTFRSAPKRLLRQFDALVTFSDIRIGKPDPQMLLAACKRLRIAPLHCLMVGDSVTDVRAAKAAKIKVIAFYSRHAASSLSDLKKLHPDRIVRSVSELKSAIRILSE